MIIGVPREIKTDEYRVALLPSGARRLKEDGHSVLVEKGAGAGSGFGDEEYARAGAELAAAPAEIFRRAELVVKVKEPQAAEIGMLRRGQIVFTYFHFASSRELTAGCLKSGIAAVAYETLADDQGRLPLLRPMSEIAGRLAVQGGAKCLESPQGGRGVLLSGATGVEPARVLILGGGAVGTNAARIAAGMRANVVIMDVSLERLAWLEENMPDNVTTLFCDPDLVEHYALEAELVIGAVLVPGGRAPRLITRAIVSRMKKGAVLVDVAIDQGGCFETSRPTTHHEPTYVVDGVIHYCVANMPGAVGRTSTQALDHATLPYLRELAGRGLEAFTAQSPGRRAALNMRNGKITNPGVAAAYPDLV